MILTDSPVSRTEPGKKLHRAHDPTERQRNSLLGKTLRVLRSIGLLAPIREPLKIPENFCVLPFVSTQVRANGSLSACCQNADSARDANHDEMLLYKDSFRAGLKSDYFKSLKKDFLAGKRPASCQRCFDEDDMGVRSRRKNENENHSHWIQPILQGKAPEQPVVFDLNLGTLCNLKCRTCGPASSSKWVQESVDLFGEDHLPRDNRELRQMPVEESRKIMLNWQDQSPDFYSTLESWLPQAERIEFFGGEPMLSKHHLNLVRKSVKSGFAKDQIIRYATNGTVVSDELVNSIWPNFFDVHLNVSVDGLEQQFEYIRYGAKWEKLLENIESYRRTPNVSAVGINITVSTFNIFYLPELFLFWEKKGLVSSRTPRLTPSGWRERLHFSYLKIRRYFRGGEIRDLLVNENNYVHIPERFDIRILPPALKQKVKEKFETFLPRLHPELQKELLAALTKMFSADLSQYWPKFIESVWFHDNYRKQSFAACFPEFHAAAVAAGVWYNYKTQPEHFFSREELVRLGHPAPALSK